jgi:hypothetical protein
MHRFFVFSTPKQNQNQNQNQKAKGFSNTHQKQFDFHLLARPIVSSQQLALQLYIFSIDTIVRYF